MEKFSSRRLLKREEGGTMVEFALLLTVLLLIVLGTIQFGLMWYTKYVITAASREGARYACVYRTDSSGTNRLPPANYSPSVEQVVKDYVDKLLYHPTYTVEVVQNRAYLTGDAGENLIVRVTCQNPWDLLGGLIPAMKNITFQSETTMKCE